MITDKNTCQLIVLSLAGGATLFFGHFCEIFVCTDATNFDSVRDIHGLSWAASVAETVRSLYFSAFNHSIISPLWLVKVRAPHWPHVRQAKFCLRVCQVVFPGYSRFPPPIDWLVSMSEIILKGTLN